MQTFANWKFYAKRAIEEEEVSFRGARGKRGREEEKGLSECVTAVAVRAIVQ
jgi:hypothetical protein